MYLYILHVATIKHNQKQKYFVHFFSSPKRPTSKPYLPHFQSPLQPTITNPHILPLSSLSNVVIVKLNSNNYFLWKAQMVPYFVVGTSSDSLMVNLVPKPSQNISLSHLDGSVICKTPKPAYSRWMHQNNLILNTLMSPSMKGYLFSYKFYYFLC